MIKRILSALLSGFLLFLCTAETGKAAYVFSDDCLLYNRTTGDKNYTCTFFLADKKSSFKRNYAWIRSGCMAGNELIVPDSVSYQGKTYPVTGFVSEDDQGFKFNVAKQKYKKVILPDNIKTVSLHSDWPNLETINIPKNLKTIELRSGQKVHYVVPDEMKHYYLRNNALYSKKNPNKLIYSMNIPAKYKIEQGTVSFEMDSFTNTNRCYIRELVVPSSVQKMGDVVFAHCYNLKKVDLSKSGIKNLSWGAFTWTKKLEVVLLPKKLKSIDKNAFHESGIPRLEIPAEVNSIGKTAFENCKKLKQIQFQSNKRIPTFGKNAFLKAHSGIKFYVKNRKMAKQLKKKLKGTKIKKARIYAGKKKKLIYKNVSN